MVKHRRQEFLTIGTEGSQPSFSPVSHKMKRKWGRIRTTVKVSYRVPPPLQEDAPEDKDSTQDLSPKYGGTIVSVRRRADGSMLVTERFSAKQRRAQAAKQVVSDAVVGAKVVGKGIYATGKAGARITGRVGRVAEGQLREAESMGHLDVDDQLKNAAHNIASRAQAAITQKCLPKSRLLPVTGRQITTCGGQVARVIQGGGNLDAERAAASTAMKMWRKSTRVVGKVGAQVIRHAGPPVAKYAIKGAAKLAARTIRYTATAIRTVVVSVASALGSALPVMLGIIAVVAALCAILPSFITGVGAEQQRQAQQRTVCPVNEAPQQSVTAEQVAEFLPRPGGVDRSGSLNEEQRQYATVIVEEGQKAGLPPRAWAIALMTALQESTLGADKSSFTPDVNHDVGIFQQRAVVGWYADGATEAENTEILNDISYAARTFYLGHDIAKDVWGGAGPKGYHIPGLVNIDNWENRDLGFVAQAVQKSAYPTAYSKHEATVAALLPTLSTRCSASAPGTSGLVDVDEYYPWWQSMGGLKAGYDPQGFAWAQCTSYVAFAIRTYSGYKDFQNNWKGQHFGNAKEWDAAARGAGIRVDQMPVVGAVAERSVGRWGHVAYIVAVNPDGTFVVNEYNHVTSRAFSSRTAKIGPGTEDFDKIIHFEAP